MDERKENIRYCALLGVHTMMFAAALEIPILFLYTRIKGNVASKYFLTASGVFFFIKAALFIAAQSVMMIYLIQTLQIVSYGLMATARVYYVDEIVGKKYETTGQAYMAATETIGIVLGRRDCQPRRHGLHDSFLSSKQMNASQKNLSPAQIYARDFFLISARTS